MIIRELCPYCGEEVRIDTHVLVCPNCGKFVKPCSLCDMDIVKCNKCIYEK